MAEERMDEEIEQLEEELKKLENKDSTYGSPSATQKDNLFKFFRHILTMDDTTRVGNLGIAEIGQGRLSVRGYKHIALYCQAEGLGVVEDYCNNLSNVLTETSMSKKGFWAQLFVTNIKKEQKLKDKTPEKKKWFSGKQTEGEGE